MADSPEHPEAPLPSDPTDPSGAIESAMPDHAEPAPPSAPHSDRRFRRRAASAGHRLLAAGRRGNAAGRGGYAALPSWLTRWAGRCAVVLVGAAIGLVLGARTTHAVGPFQANLSFTLNVSGGTTVGVPPLGSLKFATHGGPLQLDVQLVRLNQAEAEDLIRDPRLLQGVGDEAARDLRTAVVLLVVRSGLSAICGAAILSLLVYRTRRDTMISGALALGLLTSTAGAAAETWSPESLREPSYTGLLANAPTVVGDAQSLLTRFDTYRNELAGLVTNVSRLYAAASTLPAYQPDDSTVRVLHISDVHLNPASFTIVQSLVKQYGITIVADTGDLTDWGSEPESPFVAGIRALGVPYVFIRGNHDSARTARAVAKQPNAIVLTGNREVTVRGLTFLGIGDPRFTPDKSTRGDTASVGLVQSAGRKLAAVVDQLDVPPDITMVHDPVSADPLAGKVPLILAGHTHQRELRTIDGTQLMVEGSTGGAGLRGLQGEAPTPIECSVLYFNSRTDKLQAYDDITIGGLGLTEATIQRHLVTDDATARSPLRPR